ncbi:uncharacterized protein LOC135842070 [Planococcus citri]|uniref:uncharacterized protein LOC135842070 n=1 Tax=Planococcus citri TaxID=170843 RepID=UPI0031F79634
MTQIRCEICFQFITNIGVQEEPYISTCGHFYHYQCYSRLLQSSKQQNKQHQYINKRAHPRCVAILSPADFSRFHTRIDPRIQHSELAQLREQNHQLNTMASNLSIENDMLRGQLAENLLNQSKLMKDYTALKSSISQHAFANWNQTAMGNTMGPPPGIPQQQPSMSRQNESIADCAPTGLHIPAPGTNDAAQKTRPQIDYDRNRFDISNHEDFGVRHNTEDHTRTVHHSRYTIGDRYECMDVMKRRSPPDDKKDDPPSKTSKTNKPCDREMEWQQNYDSFYPSRNNSSQQICR